MKSSSVLWILITLGWQALAHAGDWPTVGGNNERNGRTQAVGPTALDLLWSNDNASYSLWGNAIFISDGKIVTSRLVFSPSYTARLQCFDLLTGDTLWSSQIYPDSRMIPLGFRDNTVYVMDWKTQLGDTLYALNADDGAIVWRCKVLCGNSIPDGIHFADNGDPIVSGWTIPQYAVMRLNRQTGDTVWTNRHFVSVSSQQGTALHGGTLYTWDGSIVTPKHVLAISVQTGVTKYQSTSLPGDGDQEIPLTVGTDGTIYAWRDGGMLYALEDTGDSLKIRWTLDYGRSYPGTYGHWSNDLSGNLYVPIGNRLFRINKESGALMDSSVVLASASWLDAAMAVDANGTVFVSNASAGEGMYFAFSPDLQTLHWSLAMPYNYYSGPALSDQGILVLAGGGTSLYGYQDPALAVSRDRLGNPRRMSLHPNYPNPFNPGTTIEFELFREAQVSLTVYNAIGQKVTTLLRGKRQAGLYKVEWQAGSMPSGVYFLRLGVDGRHETRKMLLIK